LDDKYAEMLDATTRAIALKDNDAAAFFLQGRAHNGLKDDVMAVADLTKAIALRPDFTEGFTASCRYPHPHGTV
jgi:hypothetical protein